MSQRYLGETFDIHGGGIDLIFPHHENEIAQAEGATGKTFANVWMHNGLTRINTKKISKSDADPEMQAALAKMTLHNLLDVYPGELIRFFVLSTQYRRPIEYSEAEIDSKRKGLDTFYRLFERVERLCGESPYDSASSLSEPRASARAELTSESLAAAFDEQTAAFERAMEDDFNTAGAIAALFELAAAVNRLIEKEKLDAPEPQASACADTRAQANVQNAHADALHGAASLIGTARLIGLFLDKPAAKSAGDDGLTDQVMQILIDVRQLVRKNKDFQTADLIRDRLAAAKITLEDRPDGTIWRRD